MIKQKGIVLLTTLLIISLLSLLILSQLELVFLYYQSLNRLTAKQQLFYQMEAEANKLIVNKGWLNKKSCIIKERGPNEVIRQIKNKQGCSLIKDKQQFFYLIEELGLFPCLQVFQNEQLYSTQHWRVTLLAAGEKPVLLQLRIADTAPLANCEDKTTIKINKGLISWRYQ